MAGVRRVARIILRYFVPLYLLAVLVQVFLAGEGIFGAGDTPIDDADALNPHRDFGWILAQPVALLLLIAALLAWLPDVRLRAMSIVLPFLLFIQALLATGGRWVGALHPLNAILVLALLGYLSSRLWRGREVEAAT